MTRQWLALYTAMLTKPRYRRLSPMGRGGLLHVLVLAGYQSPEATWDDPAEFRDALRLEGFPDGVADELIGLGWLEEEQGALVLRDWDKHQVAASESIRREWEARRKREWRRKARLSAQREEKKKQEEKRREDIRGEETRPGHVPDVSGTPPRPEATTTATNGHGPCPDCGAPVLSMTGSRGPFYGCSTWDNGTGCNWKSSAPPTPPPRLFVPDWDEINRVHGKDQAPS